MTTFADVKASINTNAARSFRAADGTANTEFVWLESQCLWVWYDGLNKKTGFCEKLVLVFDNGDIDGDELGYNQAEGLLGTDFESNPAMWVYDADECDLDLDHLPETSYFFELANPSEIAE